MAKPNRPGDKAPASGIYGIRGPRGGNTGEERTVVRNEPFPPTPKPGQVYEIARPTKTNRK